MKISTRELMLAWITCVGLLFAGTYIVCKPQIDSLREQHEQIKLLREQIAETQVQLAKRPQWEKRLNALRTTVRSLPAGRSAATQLMRTIGDIAMKRSVRLSDLKDGKAVTLSGLHVLPITCPWRDANTQGVRDLLIDFLAHDVMFDVTELRITSDGKDRLSGSFTVNCVFTKPEE